MQNPKDEARERNEYYRDKFNGDELLAQEIAREEKDAVELEEDSDDGG